MRVNPINPINNRRRPLTPNSWLRLLGSNVPKRGTTATRQTKSYEKLTNDADKNGQLFALNNVDAPNASTGWSIPAGRLDRPSQRAYQTAIPEYLQKKSEMKFSTANVNNASINILKGAKPKEIHCAGMAGLNTTRTQLALLVLFGIPKARIQALQSRMTTVIIRP